MNPPSDTTGPAIHDPLIVIDREWRVVHANEPAGRAFGAHPIPLEGCLLWDVLPRGVEHPLAARLRQARAEHRDVVFEDQDGASTPRFEYRIYVEPETITVLRTDVSARARASRPMPDDFLAIVSHELRAPLNAILGWAGLLRGGALDSKMARHAAEVIERNARNQAALISDLLDVSRILSGRLVLDRQVVDLAGLAESAVGAVRQAAAEKQVTVDLEAAPGAAVEGDKKRLHHVISNLLLNALRFTPAGGRVLVRLQRTGAGTEIHVSDTGVGIPPEVLPHVFERFRHGDDDEQGRRHGGLGLGPAIVGHLVEAHGGTVEARSDGAGKGTTIIVRLPAARSRTAEAGSGGGHEVPAIR